MKWSNSSNNISITTSANGVSNGSYTNMAERRQSVFYTSDTKIPVISPPIVILDQKFNGVSSKSVGITETKSKETTPTIILNGSHLLESSTDPIEMNRPDEIPADKKLKSKQSILRKRVQNIGLLDYELERKCREQQLSKVLRALLFVESKLKNEQMIIRKQLCEKDDVINRQLCTIRNLKRKYGELEDDPDGEKGINDVAQFCPKCRKNYYLYDSKSIGVQTFGTNESRDEELNNENSSIQSVEYMSSSEEADSFNSFLGARRSRKYTSKRSFKDYLNNKSTPNNTRDLSSSERSFYAESNNTNKHDSDKENNMSESNYGSTGTESIYSNFINSMHGIKTPVSPVKSILNETFSSNGSSKNETFDETVIYGNTNSKNIVESKSLEKENEQDCDTSQKYTKDMEVKQGVEPSEDWYASASDMEEGTDNGFSKVYGQSAGNPVLDCVNQILLQDNNDCFTEKEEYPSKSPSTPRSKRVHFSNQNTIHSDSQIATRAPYPIMEQDETNLQQQHFHYDVPIHYTNDYEALGSSNHYVDMESKNGSDDLGNELQHTSDKDQFQQRGIKTPPALPPKPANLIRLQKQLFARPLKLTSRSPNSKGSPSTVTGDGSEPDYCSISDVKETKTVQIVAEIHKEDCNDYSSVNDNNNQVNSEDGDSEDLEESFEDVPKLPMVQEIVPPKKKDMNKFIGLDNYITKSPYKYQAIRSSLSNRQKIAQILAEITKSSPTSNRTSPSCATTPTYDSPVNIPIVSPMSEVIDQNSDTNDQQQHIPHKSAFDWYHKETLSKRPSIIHEEPPENENGESNGNEEQNEESQQEFDYDDSGKVERPSDPITQDPIFYTGDEGEDFRKVAAKQGVLFKNMLALAETPAKLKSDKNYQFFLENSGLSSKPILPRKKRVYYTGPFV